MATWDITVGAQSAKGSGATGSNAIGPPGDFNGATITDVSVVGTPTITSDGTTDDTIGVRWNIQAFLGGDTWGGLGSDAASACSASLGDSVSSDTITDGSAPSPAPSVAVAGQWSDVAYSVNYTANMKNDVELCSWSSFTIRVTYTPADVQQEHYRFCTPITGAAHEAYTLVGSEDTSFEITLDDDYCLIVKLGNDGASSASQNWQLEYNVDGGGWNDVNAAASNVRTVESGDSDDATSGSERLTTSARSFVTTHLDEGALGDGRVARIITADSDYEFYYALTFRSADLSGGETITFRVTGATSTVTFDITPTATVPGGGPAAIFLPIYPDRTNVLKRM